jgi:hypothetical protein
MNRLSIDKEKSLEIIQNILKELKEENDISASEGFDEKDIVYNTTCTHKLRIAEISMYGIDNEDSNEYEYELSQRIEDEDYQFHSNNIEIYSGSHIDNDMINLEIYIHGSNYDDDIRHLQFCYDESNEYWILKDSWKKDNHLEFDDDSLVVILDFSNYA